MTPPVTLFRDALAPPQRIRWAALLAALPIATVAGRWLPLWCPALGASMAAALTVRRWCRWQPSLATPTARLLRGRQGQRRRLIAAHYPDAVELVVLAIRAGHSGIDALRAVVPHVQPLIAESFGAVLTRVDRGERFADALTALHGLLGPEAAPLADTFAAAERHGLPLAPILERLADEARRQRRRRADALARQLPVRLAAPLVLCALPSFVLLAVAPLVLSAMSSLEW